MPRMPEEQEAFEQADRDADSACQRAEGFIGKPNYYYDSPGDVLRKAIEAVYRAERAREALER